MAVARTKDQPHRDNLSPPSTAEAAEFLLDILGPRLTALTLGLSDPQEIFDWSRGGTHPSKGLERRLRDVLGIVELLVEVESPLAVRAWLLGMNPDLEDRAPALVLADDPELVVQAARNFVATG